ncbi:MAG: DUF1517 domain-containing protein [Cyanobacteria bacterium J06643_13]
MSQFKSKFELANLSFVSAVLFAITTAYCLKSTKAVAISTSSTPTKILAPSTTKATDSTLGQLRNWQNSNLVAKKNAKLEQASLLLAQQSDVGAEETQSSQARLLRLFSLSFFLLFFVPLGIFYPLFLFFKMLLIKPDESQNIYGKNNILSSDDEVGLEDSENQQDLGTKSALTIDQATLSKLQIAFSSPASQLREELALIGSGTSVNPDYDLVKLMHEAVAVLIEQEHWTHVSYDSITLPKVEARAEFDLISYRERNKISSEKPSFINYSRNFSSQDYKQNYSYVVVTLILCTSHEAPLFEAINTKEQLLRELIKLGRMKQDTVIKLELLWNPQQEDLYISNDQLLVEYGEMTRLF